MPKRLTIGYIQQKTLEITDNTYECLSTKYEDSTKKLEFRCKDGHLFFSTWRDFYGSGNRCPICRNKNTGLRTRTPIEKIKKEIFDITSGTCLYDDIEYKSIHTPVQIKCDKGHTFKTSMVYLRQTKGCRVCKNLEKIERMKLSYSDVKVFIESEGYSLLSESYLHSASKLVLKCDNLHVYSASFNKFKAGRRCPVCSKKKRAEARKTLTIEFIKEYLGSYGYTCLDNEFLGCKNHLHTICPNGHSYNTAWNNFKAGWRCAICYYERKRKYTSNSKEYFSYREYIEVETNKNYIKYFYFINPNKLKRSFRDYHVDHKFSVMEGFKNNVNPNIIAHPVNLQMLYWSANISKKDNSCISLQELYDAYNKFNK